MFGLFWSICFYRSVFAIFLFVILNILNNNNNNVNSNIYVCLYYSLFLKELFLDDSFFCVYVYNSFYIVNKVISATCVAANHVFFNKPE